MAAGTHGAHLRVVRQSWRPWRAALLGLAGAALAFLTVAIATHLDARGAGLPTASALIGAGPLAAIVLVALWPDHRMVIITRAGIRTNLRERRVAASADPEIR